MIAPIRYAPSRGGLVQTLDEHAGALTARICDGVRNRQSRSVEEVILDAVVPALEAAYIAGEREGSSRTEADLAATVSRLVARAVKGIRLELPICPHCLRGRTDYGDCYSCKGTGNRHE